MEERTEEPYIEGVARGRSGPPWDQPHALIPSSATIDRL